jgi:hypothetical protein
LLHLEPKPWTNHPSKVQGLLRDSPRLGARDCPMVKAGANRVVTQTIEAGQTDGRTMAVGLSVTWTHYSVRYKVISGINRCVHVDAPLRPCRRELCGPKSVRADVLMHPRGPAPSRPPVPRPPSCPHGQATSAQT